MIFIAWPFFIHILPGFLNSPTFSFFFGTTLEKGLKEKNNIVSEDKLGNY
jgi:hypothetical protein